MAGIVEFLEQDGWPLQIVEEDQTLLTAYRGENGEWQCYLRVWSERDLVSFYSVLPVYVPETLRAIFNEFITRANFGLIIGNFEMDLDDGETRYKTSIDLEGTGPHPILLRQLIYANVSTMDEHLPAILAILNGASVKEALNASS
ncbi:MAG: YbjN domain-containing protein [Caldilineaceae bacterium]|nr:YbjN domain-containing protein [Caldilineaceae bacterium]